MANVFNSVKGLHPRRNSFSAHTYRNDFTSQLGVNIPVYIQEVPPATRVKVAASALVRLQALIAPIMDNIDFYVHFWQIPYRLLENDRFTAFISGEKDPEDYDALFYNPVALASQIWALLTDDTFAKKKAHYERLIGNGSLFDFCGYDKGLFPEPMQEGGEVVMEGGNTTQALNYRALIAYFMLHLNWYMNENVPYTEDFAELVDDLVKNQSALSLCKLIVAAGDFSKYGLLPHGWDKDYFTAGLPNVQFGDPVQISLGGNAPVQLNSSLDTLEFQSKIILRNDGGLVVTPSSGEGYEIVRDDGKLKVLYSPEDDPATVTPVTSLTGNTSGNAVNVNSFIFEDEDGNEIPPFLADLTEASAITINELRFANALQVFKERQMRFGRRRLEYYKGFFDVTPEDLRLQVPKYLGGGRIPINISDIEQTTPTTGTEAMGHLAGKATAVAGGFAGFTTFCSEESIIIGIAFAMPHITYANSLSRFKLKTNDIYDYFNPSFEHLGEQAILNVEVYAGSDVPDGEFAYTPRYNEYRFHANEMHGEFKSTLAFWTLGRIFSDTPALNADFIYMQPENFDRIFAVSNTAPMLTSMLFRTRIVQPVSKYGTPMLLA